MNYEESTRAQLSDACVPGAQVGGKVVRTLDDVLAAVAGLEDGSAVRLRLVDLQGQAASFTLKVDYHYWPTYEMRRESCEWEICPVKIGD